MQVDNNFMPVIAEADHILFDTENLHPGERVPFFQSPTSFSALSTWSNDPKRRVSEFTPKMFGIHTNMLMSGYMPSGFTKEVEAVRITTSDLPDGSPVRLRLIIGATALLETELLVGEWRVIRTTDLPHNDGKRIVPGPSKPLLFTSLLSFCFEIERNKLGPERVEAKVEVKGALWTPDFTAALYETWRANEVMNASRRFFGTTVETDDSGLFDTEITSAGKARLFVNLLNFAHGRNKEHNKDTNMMTCGSIPMNHLKCITGFDVRIANACAPAAELFLTCLVRLLVNGFERYSFRLATESRVFMLDEPLWLLESEHFALEVEVLEPEHFALEVEVDDPPGACIVRANLRGPFYRSLTG